MKLNFNQQRMAIIIFARLNSRRLPKKVMSKVGSKPLLLFIIDRIKKNSNFRLPIIVATSKNKSDNEIEIVSNATRETKDMFLNCDKARKELNWKPKYSLQDGLLETIQFYKSYFSKKNL